MDMLNLWASNAVNFMNLPLLTNLGGSVPCTRTKATGLCIAAIGIFLLSFANVLAAKDTVTNLGAWELTKKIDEFTDVAKCRIEREAVAKNGKMSALIFAPHQLSWGVFVDGAIDIPALKIIESIQIRLDRKPASKLAVYDLDFGSNVILGPLSELELQAFRTSSTLLLKIPMYGDAPTVAEINLTGFSKAYEAALSCQ